MIKVQKINHDGSIKIEYIGSIRERNEEFLSIDTGWSREEMDLGYVIFEPDDTWIETFYFHRNFNIFRIGDGSGKLKGFYCNITYPPEIEDHLIKWKDLAIDIWVRPDGTYLVLDEDEFEELDPSDEERKMAEMALDEILEMLKTGKGPFSELI